MNALNWIAVLLLILGGLNWGFIGLFDFDLIMTLFGTGVLTQTIYILVGASALYRLYNLFMTKK